MATPGYELLQLRLVPFTLNSHRAVRLIFNYSCNA